MAALKNKMHERFCKNYVTEVNGKLFNGAQSAIKSGYSKKTAASQASRLLTKVNIKLRINELTQGAIEKLEINQLYALNKLKKIIEDDISNYLSFESKEIFFEDEDGEKDSYDKTNIKLKKSSDVDTWNISEISIGKDGQFRFKTHAKDKALYKMMEYLKMFEEDKTKLAPPVVVVNTLPGGDKIGGKK